MLEILNLFFLAFIPLFVAIDVLGVVPIFIALTEGIEEKTKKSLVSQATFTAFAIAIAFLVSGKLIFSFLGISEADFRIAGGLVLLVLSISDLLFSKEEDRRRPLTSFGVVPLGIPLIMGPAALTTIMILLESYGHMITVAVIVVNLFLVWLTFRYSHYVVRVLGRGGSKAIAKVFSLFMAAIGVMMIRVGILLIIESNTL